MSDTPLTADARTRAADLFERYAGGVRDWLLVRYPGADPDAVDEAVVQAVLRLADDPPGASPELALRNHAKDRLRTHFRSEHRRKAREEEYADAQVTLNGTGGPSPGTGAEVAEEGTRLRAALTRDDAERRALDLWLGGVTDPTELAVQLGLPPDTGPALAKAILARFRQRIHRLRAKAIAEDDA